MILLIMLKKYSLDLYESFEDLIVETSNDIIAGVGRIFLNKKKREIVLLRSLTYFSQIVTAPSLNALTNICEPFIVLHKNGNNLGYLHVAL